jgi:prepilin-type N-terminal cleavage/methylation domain-containing protein
MVKLHTRTERLGLTLIELLVVMAIIAILLALLFTAVQKVRDAAAQVESKNKLKNIILAVHHFADTTGRLPVVPAEQHANGGWWVPKPSRSVFVSILPFIEQTAVTRFITNGRFTPPPVHAFLSPADPTASGALANMLGVSSYAANAVAFRDGLPLAATFGDGSSNTITFAEHYAYNCNGVTFNYWANLLPVDHDRRATFADVVDVEPDTQQSRPWNGRFTFQVAPSLAKCNPYCAQTPHSSGMLVALGDGSVRSIAPGISNSTFWAAVTPNGGEILGGDWN